METSFSNQNVFDKVENWMANDTDEVTTPLSSYSDVGLAAGYEVHFSPDNERLFSDGLNEEKCKLFISCSLILYIHGNKMEECHMKSLKMAKGYL